MSDKRQRQLLNIREKWEKRADGSDLNPNKQVHAGVVHDLLTSHMSKPVSHGCPLPKIGNGQPTRKHTSNTRHAGSGKRVSTHFPPLPVKAVFQQQVASSFRLDSQHSKLGKHGFEEFKLPMIPTVVKKDRGNKEGSQLKLPKHLPPIQTSTQASCWSAKHKPEMTVLRPTTVQHSICKLPVIKNTPAKTVNLHRLPCVLPPISRTTEELDKSFKLPPV